ncbi:MAG: HepT-like ribonuclease domain-containing protein [bacterium]
MSAQTHEEDLRELRELAAEIVGYITKWSKQDVLRDKTKQRVLERTLELLGEVATRLGDDHPDVDIDWRNLRGLRVRLAHAYDDLDAGRLWDYADRYVRRLADEG